MPQFGKPYRGAPPIQPRDRTSNSALGSSLVAPKVNAYQAEIIAFMRKRVAAVTDMEILAGTTIEKRTTAVARRRELELEGKIVRMEFKKYGPTGRQVACYRLAAGV